MDMCYDGTLVMPSSYAMMEEDEMCYVEGGITTINTMTAKSAVNYFNALYWGFATECDSAATKAEKYSSGTKLKVTETINSRLVYTVSIRRV